MLGHVLWTGWKVCSRRGAGTFSRDSRLLEYQLRLIRDLPGKEQTGHSSFDLRLLACVVCEGLDGTCRG